MAARRIAARPLGNGPTRTMPVPVARSMTAAIRSPIPAAQTSAASAATSAAGVTPIIGTRAPGTVSRIARTSAAAEIPTPVSARQRLYCPPVQKPRSTGTMSGERVTGVFWGMEVADGRHDTIGRREPLTGTEVFPMRHSMRPRRSMPSASASLLALACVVAAAAMTASPARADDEFEFKLLRPTVSVSALAEPNADFKDADGQFRANNFTLGTNIPLGGVHIHTKGDLVAHQILLTALAGTGSQTIDSPALELTPRLYTGLLAGSVLFGTRKGNLYYGSLGASFAEEDDAEGGPQARPYGLFLGSFRNSHGVMFTYGAAFTYLFGRGLLLPAFGVVWSPNPTWTISGFLPFSWRFTQKLSDKFRMNYLLNAAGQQY